jgi:DNA invertase Pin-like site-specific DNA recombinase
MKVAIYARVSTADQNPEGQLAALRDYAATRSFPVVFEYVDQITGAVEKRSKTKQTMYNRLLLDAHKRMFDCVLVWKFDRFARSLPALLNALDTFKALGIDFISITQMIDTTTPTGRLFFSMVGAFAEFERELITERSKAGVALARKRGVKFGPPRDLLLERKVRKLHQDGMSGNAIAKKLGRSSSGISKILKREG